MNVCWRFCPQTLSNAFIPNYVQKMHDIATDVLEFIWKYPAPRKIISQGPYHIQSFLILLA